MNLADLRRRLDDASRRVHAAADAIDQAADGADLEPLQRALDDAVADAERARAALEQAEARSRARASFPMPDQTSEPDAPAVVDRTPVAAARVTREERTYRPDSTDYGFFADLIRCKNGDLVARERLMRNNREVLGLDEGGRIVGRSRYSEAQVRAISQTAGAGGEFVYPVWLAEVEPLLRAGRAFADRCTGLPLPDGTNQINVPKVTTGASTAVQTDGGAVSNTDLVTTSVAAQVQSIAGRTVASYQLIDLGTGQVDRFIQEDLLADYWRTFDTALISGAVANAKGILNVTGINAITYTDASPTGPELYAPAFQAKSQVEKGVFAPVDFWLTHPSEWNWFLSQLDTANRPLAEEVSAAKLNALAEFSAQGAQGVAGTFGGLPVIVDANMPVNLGGGTNETRWCALNRRTLVTYEGVPRFKVADQTNIANLQYQFVMWGYYAAAFPRQPKAISVISGTGMIVQSGF